MTIYNSVIISGVEYNDYNRIKIVNSTSDNSQSSNYQIEFPSPYGRHKTDFNVGDDIKVYSDNNLIQIESPFAHWKLDNGSDSIRTYNGDIISGTFSEGKVGNCIGFVGDYLGSGYVGVASGADFSLSGTDASIFSWVKCDPNLVGVNAIFSKYWTGGGGHREYFIAVTSGTTLKPYLSLYYHPGNGASGMSITATTDYDPAEWNHVGFTKEGSLYKIYANSNLVGSVFNPSGTYQTTGSTYIGAVVSSTSTPDHQFHGYIDDVRFYNRSLTNNEISTIYNNGNGIEKYLGSQIKFRGAIESVSFEGEQLNQRVNISGRDYTARLIDNTVSPVVYTNTEVGSIVRKVINDNLTDIGSHLVPNTGVTLKRMVFNDLPIYDALTELSDLSAHNFYVDTDKNLHFEPIGSSSSGYTFTHGNNIIRMDYDRTRQGMANVVKVYGDRYLSAVKEINKLNGSVWEGSVGSVFGLQYKPNNLQVEYLGSIRKGAIFQANLPPYSGPDYFVNYEDAQVIFNSGTNLGYSAIPVSGGSIICNYARSLPIVKQGSNRNSIKLFGQKTKIINDKTIKDPNIATAILNAEIANSDPFNNVELQVKGWYDLQPGQTCDILFPEYNLDTTYPIIETEYIFDEDTVQSENVLTLKLDKRTINITDRIRELNRKIQALEAADKSNSDIVTRLEYSADSVEVIGSYWEVRTRIISGDSIWGNAFCGSRNYWSSGVWDNSYANSWVVQRSGGYNYT